jgi:hypothetical protein
MNPSEMKVGAVYMVRGGHILRYRGIYASRAEFFGHRVVARIAIGTCLAFGPVTDEGPFDPPVGASIASEDVLYEITPKDLPWILVLDRKEQMLSRKLDVADIEHLIAELKRPV